MTSMSSITSPSAPLASPVGGLPAAVDADRDRLRRRHAEPVEVRARGRPPEAAAELDDGDRAGRCRRRPAGNRRARPGRSGESPVAPVSRRGRRREAEVRRRLGRSSRPNTPSTTGARLAGRLIAGAAAVDDTARGLVAVSWTWKASPRSAAVPVSFKVRLAGLTSETSRPCPAANASTRRCRPGRRRDAAYSARVRCRRSPAAWPASCRTASDRDVAAAPSGDLPRRRTVTPTPSSAGAGPSRRAPRTGAFWLSTSGR